MISVEPPDQPEVVELIRLGDEFGLTLYPAASYYGLPLAELLKPHVTFFVARDEQSRALGTAALADRGDGTGELKRMFVRAEARGRGLAGSLLAAVEGAAAASGLPVMLLETGPKQPEAMALYRKNGYAVVDQFAPYIGDADSICMRKVL